MPYGEAKRKALSSLKSAAKRAMVRGKPGEGRRWEIVIGEAEIDPEYEVEMGPAEDIRYGKAAKGLPPGVKSRKKASRGASGGY